MDSLDSDGRREARGDPVPDGDLESVLEELQTQAMQLEDAQAELEAANDELHRANRELAERREEAERERADAEVARARLEAVLRQMPSGVLLVDAPSGRLVLGNEQLRRIWRLPAPHPDRAGEDARYRGLHPDGRPYRLEEWPLRRAIAGERVVGEEIEILRGDGTHGFITVSSAPIEDRDGAVVAAVAVFEDVTDRAEWEREQSFLAEAGRLLASSLDYEETLRSVARLAVPRVADWCAVDVLEEGEIRRLAVAHSDPEKEALAREIERRWPTDPESHTGVPQVLRTGMPELAPELSPDLLRAAARDDEHFRVLSELEIRSAMLVPMLARGRTLGVITFVSAESGRRFDADDLRSAEHLADRAAVAVDNARLYRAARLARDEAEAARREAEAANRAKSAFLATMSHEIRTPINAILGYTDLLSMGLSGPVTEEQTAQLDRVRVSGHHLLMLIEDVLDLAKVESGSMEVARERALALDAIQEALSLVSPQASEHDVRIEAPCADDRETFYVGDDDRVRQILVNVLGNAIKFTGAGGEVRIACGTAGEADAGEADAGEAAPAAGPWTYIRVSDTGIGIAPEDLQRVFLPFQQAEDALTRTRGGTGLGLSISRQFARLMGGDLTVTSEPGVGSVFTLWLPREQALPGSLTETLHRDGRGDARPRGAALAGEALQAEIAPVLRAFVRRLAADPLMPGAASLEGEKLANHTSALLADVAQTLIVLEEGDRPNLIQDSSEIQRLISELHGAQRARLGWTEAAVRREFEILGEEVEAAVRRKGGQEAQSREALGALRHILDHALRISLQTMRREMARTAP